MRGRLRIVLTTPSPPGLVDGNRITARRYARLFRDLGHRATVVEGWDGRPADVLVALTRTDVYDLIEASEGVPLP